MKRTMYCILYFVLYNSRKNHDSEKTIERSHGGPKDKVKEAGGLQIFHQQFPRVKAGLHYQSFCDHSRNFAYS